MNSTVGSDIDNDGEATPSSIPHSSSSTNSVTSESDSKGGGELLNTSSFARRLAHGEEPCTKRDPKTKDITDIMAITPSIDFDEEFVTSSPRNSLHDNVSSDAKEARAASVKTSEGGGGESGASTKTATTPESEEVKKSSIATFGGKAITKDSVTGGGARPSQKASAYYSTPPPQAHEEAKTPFSAFHEYVAFFFNKAEVYEEELERQESVRHLQMNKTHHGSKILKHIPSTLEGMSSSSEDGSVDGDTNETAAGSNDDKTKEITIEKEVSSDCKSSRHPSSPKLSEAARALAALEALSFRNLTDVHNSMKEKHSLQIEDENSNQKKQRVTDEGPSKRIADEGLSKPVDVVDESTKKMWKNNWEVFVTGKKKERFPDVALENLALPLSVEEFSRLVIKDDATHSIGKFMCDIGELKVDSSPWQPSQTRVASEASMRTIHYTHPVNAPMAPPQAKARKQQMIHKFGDVGLCLETCTLVEEVPMADCFVVNDRLWVQEAEGEEKGCIVSATFQIKFVKSTMFRRIIEGATRKEYAIFWDQFADMIRTLKSPLASEEGEEELEEVANELEVATMELERVASGFGEGGVEVPLSSVLTRIRISSRRLSVRASKLPLSNFTLGCDVAEDDEEEEVKEKVEEKPVLDVQKVFTFGEQVLTLVLDGITYTKEKIYESDNGMVLACVVGVIFFMAFFNMLALRQMMMMNRYMHDLDARLGRMNELNEALMLKLANCSVGGSC